MITPQSIFEALKAKREDDERAKACSIQALQIHPIAYGPGKEQLEALLKILPPLSNSVGPWIAGGATRRLLQGLSLESGDIDLFFYSKKIWMEFTDALDGFEKTFVSDNAITFLVHGFKVQLIKRRYYESVQAVFEDFDYSICQIAYKDGYLVAPEGAVEDIHAGVLRLAKHGRNCHQTAIGRFTKYVNYGFVPEAGLYPTLIRKALDRTSAWNVFDSETRDDDAWYNGAPSEENHFTPQNVVVTTPGFHNPFGI